MIILSTDVGNFHRIIPTDGRPHVGPNAKFWFGNSRGRWEGDTLVVEITNLNGRGWFDTAGNFFTENTKMVERWRLADANTIDYSGDDRGPHHLYAALDHELPEAASRHR